MAKKKEKQGKKEKIPKKDKAKGFAIEVGQIRSDVKTFIERFKSDVDKKRKAYQLYAQKGFKRR